MPVLIPLNHQVFPLNKLFLHFPQASREVFQFSHRSPKDQISKQQPILIADFQARLGFLAADCPNTTHFIFN